jgi:hypothetical protein
MHLPHGEAWIPAFAGMTVLEVSGDVFEPFVAQPQYGVAAFAAPTKKTAIASSR